MRTPTLLLVVAFMVTVAQASAQPVAATGDTAIVTNDSGLFLVAGTSEFNRPICVVTAGSTVTVVGADGDWYRVEFNDPMFGKRVGYVAKGRVRVVPRQAPSVSPTESASVADAFAALDELQTVIQIGVLRAQVPRRS